KLRSLAAALLSLVLAAPLGAQDKKPAEKEPEHAAAKEGDVPKAGIDAVKNKYPKGALKAFVKDTYEKKEGEKEARVRFQVKLKDGKRKLIVYVDADGKIQAEDELIDFAALPDVFKKALKGEAAAFSATGGVTKTAIKTVPNEK